MWYKWNGTLCVEKEVMHLCAVSGSLALAHGGVCTVFDLSCASKTLKQSLIQSGCITSYLLCVSLSLLTYIFIFILQTCPCQFIYFPCSSSLSNSIGIQTSVLVFCSFLISSTSVWLYCIYVFIVFYIAVYVFVLYYAIFDLMTTRFNKYYYPLSTNVLSHDA